MKQRTPQASFTFPNQHGGRRKGAGRKPKGERAGVPHRRRPLLKERFPVHVTLRVRKGVPSLRSRRFVRAFRRSLAEACERGDFRVVHYALLSNHVHLLVEADDRRALASGMKSVGARLARAANRVFERSGAVLDGRFHSVVLRSPLQVRRALRYDGLLPNVMEKGEHRAMTPDDVRAMRAFVEAQRPGSPFDIVVEGRTPGADPTAAREAVAKWRDAGASVWLEQQWAVDPDAPSDPTAVRERIAQGPPRLEAT